MIERPGDAMCGLHHAQGDEESRFLGSASKPRLAVSPGLASKPVATSFLVWPQKQGRWFSWFGPQNWQLRFSDLAHKITVTVSWFGPQN
jgi:hypothetical protein